MSRLDIVIGKLCFDTWCWRAVRGEVEADDAQKVAAVVAISFAAASPRTIECDLLGPSARVSLAPLLPTD